MGFNIENSNLNAEYRYTVYQIQHIDVSYHSVYGVQIGKEHALKQHFWEFYQTFSE